MEGNVKLRALRDAHQNTPKRCSRNHTWLRPTQTTQSYVDVSRYRPVSCAADSDSCVVGAAI